jgi:transcriptional regulator with XRE-family HTH domain
MFDRNKLKEVRQLRSWTTKVLAEKSGVSHVVIRRLESGGKSGNRQPRPDTLAKLARALEVPIEDLLSLPEAWSVNIPMEDLLSSPRDISSMERSTLEPQTDREQELQKRQAKFRKLSPEDRIKYLQQLGLTEEQMADPVQIAAAMRPRAEQMMKLLPKLLPVFLRLSPKDQETMIAFGHFLQERAEEQEQKEEEG